MPFEKLPENKFHVQEHITCQKNKCHIRNSSGQPSRQAGRQAGAGTPFLSYDSSPGESSVCKDSRSRFHLASSFRKRNGQAHVTSPTLQAQSWEFLHCQHKLPLQDGSFPIQLLLVWKT